MKEKFKGYYRLQKQEFSQLWKNSIFVFDTNVLLNLYRYQSSTRDELLKVLVSLKNRIWIPNHVGLEYQRNRLSVIAEQHKRYSEVRDIVTKSISDMQRQFENLQLKKRHSHINPDVLLNSINEVKEKFLGELDELEKQSINVNSEDHIRNRLERLFENNVGEPFASQDELDSLFEDGDWRNNHRVPPGFKDINKDKEETDTFFYGNLFYKRKYGDLIVWKQIIEHAKSSNIKDLIFVTDDSKSDWWWKVDSSGIKTIGARPELIDEIYRNAGVERFYMYNTEGFLNYANEQLNAQIAEKAIEEVREVSFSRKEPVRDIKRFFRFDRSAEHAVFDWLSKYVEDVVRSKKGFPDFIAYKGDNKYGYEVKVMLNSRAAPMIVKEVLYRAYHAVVEQNFYEFVIILVFMDEEFNESILNRIKDLLSEFNVNLKIIIGLGEYDEDSESVILFTPYHQFSSLYSLE